MNRVVIALVLSCVWCGRAAADDGSTIGVTATGALAVGPVPDATAVGRGEAQLAKQWGRLHVGVGGGLGTGGNAQRIWTAYAELGLWLHASARVDLMLGWRLGQTWLTIFDSTV